MRRPTRRPRLLLRWIECKACNGLGKLSHGKLCGTCRGHGQIWVAD